MKEAMERAKRRMGETKKHLLGGPDRSAVEQTSYFKRHRVSRDAPIVWQRVSLRVRGDSLSETVYEKTDEGIAKITIDRPEKRNAFTPRTILELIACLEDAKEDGKVACIIVTGKGTQAFCSGGDQLVRDVGGYVGKDGVPRLNFLDLQVVLRRIPKPVVAMVAGHAVGGGHIIHMLCDLTISADNAIYGQTGPKVGSFDAGWGCSVMARLVGPKRAKEMWFLCKLYTAEEAYEMGLVNKVVPLAELEKETVYWCRQMLANSPLALSILKASMNAVDDGHAGVQQLGGFATKMFYSHEQGLEGLTAFKEKRKPDFEQFRKK